MAAPYLAAVPLLYAMLLALTGWLAIPPKIESDYCYLFTAADRFAAGEGLTTTPPVAPHQPWTFHDDWTFLTRWPTGYPILIAATRLLTGATAIQAAQWLAPLFCAIAMVGWFALARTCVPRGPAGTMLSLLVAGCSVSPAVLINPSTDQIVVAAVPLLILLAAWGIGRDSQGAPRVDERPRTVVIVTAGLLAGGLFWIRYASVFVPLFLGLLFGVCAALRQRSSGFRAFRIFCVSALVPVGMLVLINRAVGTGASTQAQFNLGTRLGFDLSVDDLAQAWANMTSFGFYDHRPEPGWFFAAWPLLVLGAVIFLPAVRKAAITHFSKVQAGATGLALFALMFVLIAANTLFSHKFDFVALPRYYMPAKPLYFLVFAAPLLWLDRRWLRAGAMAACFVGCSWLVRYEWPRPLLRWKDAGREVTSYGQWANCFEPGAGEVYGWLRGHAADDLVVVSNFHEWIVMETGIPALPVPPDKASFDGWLEQIRRQRGCPSLRVVFVLDRENKWRDYWMPDPGVIMDRFALRGDGLLPDHPAARLLPYVPTTEPRHRLTRSTVPSGDVAGRP